jgi:hypothetical protein
MRRQASCGILWQRDDLEKTNDALSIDNSHYRLILKLDKEMQINHHI